MGDVNELQKKGTKTMANLPGSIKNLNTLLGEQLLEGGGSGGGGSSWQTVFEGNVTTEQSEMGNIGLISYNEQLTADTLKITFDGIEYECDKRSTGTSNIYGGLSEYGPDFSEYPFAIVSRSEGTQLFTESAGSHSLKIETSNESGGGGSSDFSTAEVTVVWNTARKTAVLYGANFTNIDDSSVGTVILDGDSHKNFEAILYQQKATYEIDREKSSSLSINVSGNAELDEDYIYITGDCTITIS